MEYLLKASAVIAIFYLCYKLFLQRDTFFESNRGFLLLGLITAFLIPFVVIPIYIEYTPTAIPNYALNGDFIITENPEKPFNIFEYLPLAYIFGVVLFTIRLLFQFLSLVRIIFINKSEKQGKFRLVKTSNAISPFSFFNWIVYNPKLFNINELELIIAHEKIHVKQYHSIDILITQLACIVLWFNPFIWLYNKDLKQNLEFIADQNAQRKSECKKSYQHTLLKTSMPTHQLALSNNFYNSLIKKRIVMLQKSKSKKRNLFKYALVLPFIALFLMSYNTEDVYVEKPSLENETENKNLTNKIAIITKNHSDSELNTVKRELADQAITVVFSEIWRNSKNEIIQLTAKVKNDKGSGGATWKNDDNPIPNIEVGELENGQVISRTITNNVNTQNNSANKIQDKKIANTYVIKKNTTDKELEQIKSTIIKKEGKFTYNHKRNSKGEITYLKFEIKSKGTGNYTSELPFELIYFGTFHDAGIFIAENEDGFQKILESRKLLIAAKNKKDKEKLKSVINTNNSNQDTKKSNFKNASKKQAPKVREQEKQEDFTFIITKDFTDEDLKSISKEARTKGATLKFSKIKRNSKNEIIAIKAEFKSDIGSGNFSLKGKTPIKSFSVNKNGFLKYGTSHKSKVFIGVPLSNAQVIGYGDVKFKEGNKLISSDSIIFNKKNNTIYSIGHHRDSIKKSPWKVTIGVNAADLDSSDFFYNTNVVKSNVLKNSNNLMAYSNSLKTNKIGNRAIVLSGFKGDIIYYLDGKEISQQELKELSPNDIESVTVLKGKEATLLRGVKANHDVVRIKSKKNSSWTVSSKRNNVLFATKDTIYVNEKPNILEKMQKSYEQQPLYIVDGKEITQKELALINEQNIESVSVLKGNHAIKKHGDKGKNGVVLIKMKNNNSKNPFIKIVDYKLYILDGKKIKKDKFENINHDNIESINVLKGDSAIEKYGKKAKDGVVEITTKKKN